MTNNDLFMQARKQRYAIGLHCITIIMSSNTSECAGRRLCFTRRSSVCLSVSNFT